MIDEPNLDTMLAASRPAVAPAPLRVERAWRTASAAHRARAWRRPAAVAALAGAGVLAVGAGAAATVGLPSIEPTGSSRPHTQTVSNGDQCHADYRITNYRSQASDGAMAAAQAALASLDIDSLDISEDIRDVIEGHAQATWEGPGPEPAYFYLRDSLDAVESTALSRAVYDAVIAEVRAAGFKPRGISMESSSICDDHAMDPPVE
jgi:hypothetical protein